MLEKCEEYLNKLCVRIPERPVGSEGNRQVTVFFQEEVEGFGWDVESTPFQAMNWKDGGAEFQIGQKYFEIFPSPYSKGCSLEAELMAAGTIKELETIEAAGKLLLLYGELTKEQLMPKKFVFYNPEEHQRIITLLEKKNPAAILTATTRNASLAGGVYPFPLIEDGDFHIPSVFLTEDEGKKLLPEVGAIGKLTSSAQRIPAEGFNLAARKGTDQSRRITISAHIDAKIGTPGAIDNATGVIVLLMLAEKLKDYQGRTMIELLPFNGEDYFAASGQMIYLDQNQDRFNEILININIDGAGFHQGPSAFSPFNLPDEIQRSLDEVLDSMDDLEEGRPWYQGDHSIFLQQGVPAVAVSSSWFVENVDRQEITHTSKDHPGIVNCVKLVDITTGIYKFIQKAYLA